MLPTHRRVTCDCCCSTNNANTPSFARYQRPNLQSHLPRCPPRCHICLILRAVLQQTRLVHFVVSFRVMFACPHVQSLQLCSGHATVKAFVMFTGCKLQIFRAIVAEKFLGCVQFVVVFFFFFTSAFQFIPKSLTPKSQACVEYVFFILISW